MTDRRSRRDVPGAVDRRRADRRLDRDHRRARASLPVAAALPRGRRPARAALELEDWFDRHLGPQIRRLAFYELSRDPRRFTELAVRYGPPSAARFPRLSGIYARQFTTTRFRARSAARAQVAHRHVLDALDRLERELDGNEYLAGDRFSVADLTAAALFYPLVAPAGGPVDRALVPPSMRELTAPLRERPGFRWVEEMYRRHRRYTRPPRIAPATGL